MQHVQTVYNDVLESNGSIVLAVQSISNSITHYAQANNLDLKVNINFRLKKFLFFYFSLIFLKLDVSRRYS